MMHISEKHLEEFVTAYHRVAANNLIHEANEKEGIDNISVILIEHG